MAEAKREDNNGITKVPQPHGGALNSGGTPGNKGGTGKPPKSFSTFMRELRESPDVQAAIQRAALDESSRGFHPVLNKLAEYDPEKPGQKLEVAGAGGGPIVVKIVREGKRPPK